MPNLFVELVAPGRKVFQGEAKSVRAPGVEGSFTVLYNHAPMLAAFQIGSLFITTAEGKRIEYATNGGFLEIVDNRVTVLAESAEPATEIDIERAQAAEVEARKSLASALTDEQRAEAEEALERSRNLLRVSMGKV